jgi:hypothetical protein
MALSDITENSVQRAIKEFDRFTGEKFLNGNSSARA